MAREDGLPLCFVETMIKKKGLVFSNYIGEEDGGDHHGIQCLGGSRTCLVT